MVKIQARQQQQQHRASPGRRPARPGRWALAAGYLPTLLGTQAGP
jgi:hypothetical protein